MAKFVSKEQMVELTEDELTHVSGGTVVVCIPCIPCIPCTPCDGDGGKEKHPNNGYGNQGYDGVPGNSNHQDYTR